MTHLCHLNESSAWTRSISAGFTRIESRAGRTNLCPAANTYNCSMQVSSIRRDDARDRERSRSQIRQSRRPCCIVYTNPRTLCFRTCSNLPRILLVSASIRSSPSASARCFRRFRSPTKGNRVLCSGKLDLMLPTEGSTWKRIPLARDDHCNLPRVPIRRRNLLDQTISNDKTVNMSCRFVDVSTWFNSVSILTPRIRN